MDVGGDGDKGNGMLNVVKQLKKFGRSTGIC